MGPDCFDPACRRGVYVSGKCSSPALAKYARLRVLHHRIGYGCLGRFFCTALWIGNGIGTFLDPVADKLMVSAALIVLLAFGRVEMLIALIIIGREITVTALREWMAKIGESGKVKVNWVGKIKTISQMVAIPMLLFYEPLFGLNIKLIGTILFTLQPS